MVLPKLRSVALEAAIIDLRPPAAVRRVARRMARPALLMGADLGLNTWMAILLQLWDARRAHVSAAMRGERRGGGAKEGAC